MKILLKIIIIQVIIINISYACVSRGIAIGPVLNKATVSELKIHGIFKNHPLYILGLRKNDRILKINNSKVKSNLEKVYKRFFLNIENRTTNSLLVKRKQKILLFTFKINYNIYNNAEVNSCSQIQNEEDRKKLFSEINIVELN